MKFLITKKRNWTNQYDLESISIVDGENQISIKGKDMEEFLAVLNGERQVFQSRLEEGEYLPNNISLCSNK